MVRTVFGSVAKWMSFRSHSSFQSRRISRQCLFIGPRAPTSRGCMRWVEFSGRKQKQMLCC